MDPDRLIQSILRGVVRLQDATLTGEDQAVLAEVDRALWSLVEEIDERAETGLAARLAPGPVKR